MSCKGQIREQPGTSAFLQHVGKAYAVDLSRGCREGLEAITTNAACSRDGNTKV